MTLNEWIKANGDKEVVFEEDGKFSIKESEPEKCYRWEPNKYDNYWFITHSGQSEKNCWDDDYVDHFRCEIGNVFKTEDEAEDYIERLRIRAELLHCGGKETFEKSSCRWAIGWSDGHLTPDEWYVQVPPHSTFGSIPMSRLKPPLKKWVKKELRNIFLVSRIS